MLRNFLGRIAQWLARHPYVPALLACTLFAGFAFPAARLSVDPGNEALFLTSDPAREGQAILNERFGGDDFLIVALERPDLFSEAGLGALDDLTFALGKKLGSLGWIVNGEPGTGPRAPGRAAVVSLTVAKNIYANPHALAGMTVWSPYDWYLDGYRTDADGEDQPYGLDELREDTIDEPLFRGNLISPDGTMAAVLITFEHASPEAKAAATPAGGPDTDTDDRALPHDGESDAPESAGEARVVEVLRAVTAEFTDDDQQAYLAGFPVERYDFSRLIEEDQALFIPLIVLAIALSCGFLFRQFWGVILPLLVVGLTVVATRGLAELLGKPLNAVTSLLTPVVMVVSVAVAINLAIAYGQETRGESDGRGPGGDGPDGDGPDGDGPDGDGPDGGGPDGRGPDGAVGIGNAYRSVGPACLFTTLTTVLGFGSLAISDVPAIQDFGMLCAFGVGFSYLAALLILPAFFGLPGRMSPRWLRAPEGRLSGALRRLGPAIVRRRGWVVGAALLVAAFAFVGVQRLRTETDILAQLPQKSDLAIATRAIDRGLGGVNSLEILFTGEPGTFHGLEALRALDVVQTWANAQRKRGVQQSLSIVDILAQLESVRRGRRELPTTPDHLRESLGFLKQAGDNAPTRMVLSADGAIARLTVRLKALPASKVYAILQDVVATATAAVPEGVEVLPAGHYVLIQNMAHELPRSQLRGMIVATVLIVIAIALLFSSLKLGALAAIPASIPILFTYGLMGWVGIDLSTATSMIASVVIGLAVDSTILFLARYRDESEAGHPPTEALSRMLATAGHSVTFSNLTLVAGFAVGMLSSFPPVRDFSLLTAGTIAFTYLGALFLLPALIAFAQGWLGFASAPPDAERLPPRGNH